MGGGEMSGNEPAFPTPQRIYANGDTEWGSNGMTLRDWFAAKALQGILSNPVDTYKDVTRTAYLFADEMLKVREDVK
jgi:hypothetical protein